MSRLELIRKDEEFFGKVISLFNDNIFVELYELKNNTLLFRRFNFDAQNENFCGIEIPSSPLTDEEYANRLQTVRTALGDIARLNIMELIQPVKIVRQLLLISFVKFPEMLIASRLSATEYAYTEICKRTVEFITQWERYQEEKAKLIDEFFSPVDFKGLKESLIPTIQLDANDSRSSWNRRDLLNMLIARLNSLSTNLITDRRELIDIAFNYCFCHSFRCEGSRPTIHHHFILREDSVDDKTVKRQCAEFVFEKICDGVLHDQIIKEKIIFRENLLKDRLKAKQDKLISDFIELQMVIERIDALYKIVGENNGLNAEIRNALLNRYAELKTDFFNCVEKDKQQTRQSALRFLKESLDPFVYDKVIPKVLLTSHKPTHLGMLSCLFLLPKKTNASSRSSASNSQRRLM